MIYSTVCVYLFNLNNFPLYIMSCHIFFLLNNLFWRPVHVNTHKSTHSFNREYSTFCLVPPLLMITCLFFLMLTNNAISFVTLNVVPYIIIAQIM